MAINRMLSIIAVLLSLAAIVLSVQTIRRDPVGTDLSKYDLSSPERTLRSVNAMIKKQDIRAGLQFLKNELQGHEGNEWKLFLADDMTLSVLKSIEISDSGVRENNGIIVSFVKFNISGVDYYTVQCFRKDQSSRFFLEERSPAFGEQKSESDKNLDAAIEEFEKSGKLN
jgi:hypothetical protein